jgi:transcription initiation factor TFIID subunit TAF12
MKTAKTKASRPHQLREAYRRQLGELGVFIEGTLSQVRRPGRKPPAWQLTFKQAGKTRTVYVPVELAQEVQQWAQAFKRLKQLVRKITQQNLAIIRRHVAARRAANRALRPTAKRSGGNSARFSGTASRR